MLCLGALLQVLAQTLRAWPTPPFPLYAVSFFLASLGQAYQDTHANTFVASVGRSTAHRWLGFIHAMYMAGCLAGPFASASIASASSGKWYLFYSVPLGLGVANLGLAAWAFRDTTMSLFSAPKHTTSPNVTSDDTAEMATPSATALIKATLSQPAVWLLSVFFFFYLGVSITASGWVVQYLVDVRNGELSKMGYVPAGYSGGCLLGRILLPEPTHKYGERKMGFIYCVLCLGLQLLFWL